MSEHEKTIFLANVIAIASLDGRLTSGETQMIESVRKQIRARKSDANKAEVLAGTLEYTPKQVGRFANCVANLEAQIRTALSDGSIADEERSALAQYASDVQVTDAQFQTMVVELENMLSGSDALGECAQCKAAIPGNAKFCPECGNKVEAVEDGPSIALSYDIPTSGFAIEFAESTASGFADALARVQSAPVSASCLKARKTWYMGAWPTEQIVEAARLASDLKGMRNRKVWVDGKEHRWDDVFGFVWCREERESAYRPVEYCFGLDDKQLNVWGCKQARMAWSEWAEWFSYGKFEKRGLRKNNIVFVFDKERIRHELQTSLFKFRFCPHLNLEFVEAVIQAFPEEVNPGTDQDWKYKRDYDESPGSLKITEKSDEDGFSFVDEYYSSGVVPRSPKVAGRILNRAAAAIGIDKPLLGDALR